MTVAALGYGCSALMGRSSRRESVALLEAAFDSGISHFDVARSYGYGEAEAAVGDFLARHGDGVTVTTKLGIEPPPRSRRLTVAKAAVRRLGPLSGALRGAARRSAQHLQQAGSFDVSRARVSLETSLAELRTEHVDLLLLHECAPHDLTDELFDFLIERREAGVIGEFGIASRPDQTRAILEHEPRFAPAVQVADAVASPVLNGLRGLEGRRLYTHSALGEGLRRIHTQLLTDPARARSWSEVTGVDCADRERLGALCLGWARASNASGTVLFSSRNPDRIRSNAESPLPGPAVVARFGALVRGEPVAERSSVDPHRATGGTTT